MAKNTVFSSLFAENNKNGNASMARRFARASGNHFRMMLLVLFSKDWREVLLCSKAIYIFALERKVRKKQNIYVLTIKISVVSRGSLCIKNSIGA